MVRVSLLCLVVATVGCVSGRAGTRGGDGGSSSDAGQRADAGTRDAGGVRDAGRDAGPPPPERVCGDGLDQDRDGRADCDDEDCANARCNETGGFCIDGTCGGCRDETMETACGDGADEDCDGATDCADADCNAQVCGPGGVFCGKLGCPCPSGFSERICDDLSDDDCDALIDCDDPDCFGLVCGTDGEVCVSGGICACSAGAEVCNGADDDCSGVVDDGCPRGLSTCCGATGPAFGGGTSGTVFSDPCPPNTMLMGVAGRASGRLDRIQPLCAALIVERDPSGGGELAYPVRRSAPIVGAFHGGEGGTAFEDRCPGNDIAIGVHGNGDANGVTSIALQCATVTIMRAGAAWRLVITPSSMTPVRGDASAPLGGDCASGGVVTELNGRASGTVERIGSTCQELQLLTM